MATPITRPEFCPRKTCPNHQRKQIEADTWYYYSKCRGDIQRFRCKACGKTFSTQTFSIHYWTHSTIDFWDLAQWIYSCSSLLQIGRYNHFTYRVVQNRIRRLARNCL
jgi:transposase-like protein